MSQVVSSLCVFVTRHGGGLVRIAAGLYVLAAALAKTHQLWQGFPLDLPTGWPWWTGPLLIEAELLFASILLTGLFPRLIRWLAPALFLVLAAFALTRAMSGAASCGCFGVFTVNPRVTFLLDLAIALAWLCTSPAHGLATNRHVHAFAAQACCLAVVVLPLPMLAKSTPATLTTNGQLVGDAKVVILDPESWIGQPLPLLSHIDIGPQLMAGRWRVVFHRQGCEECRRLLANLESHASEFGVLDAIDLALIEVPAFEQAVRNSPRAASRFLSGNLSHQRQWLIETPLAVELVDGIVTAVHDEPEMLANESRGFPTISSMMTTPPWRQP